MISTTGSEDLRGRVAPITVPKGISPSLRPSIKNISPRMTASRPPVISQEILHQLSQDQQLEQHQVGRKGGDRLELVEESLRNVRLE